MFPDRGRPNGPGFQVPTGRRMQQPGPFRGPQQQNPHNHQPMMRIAQNRPQGFQGPPFQHYRQEPPPPKKEGFLAKILGRSKQNAAPPNLFAPASSATQGSTRNSGGGILETLKNPNSLNDMLNNTQKVLQAAEQFTPMVQQYGPVIKNLPSMWKVFRSISSSDDTEKSEDENKPTNAKPKSENLKANPHIQEPVDKTSATRHPKTKRNRSSGPKLYI